jgi:transposase-like protein
MPPPPRIARSPLTSKHPESCPHCGSHVLNRRGARRKKLEIVQLWRCASCKRVFTPGPAALHNKTYPLRMILQALTDYDLGYSLQQCAARLKKKTNRAVSPSTISSWLELYANQCSFRALRAQAHKRFPPEQTIYRMKLYHRQIYGFAYHRPKLEFLRSGVLDIHHGTNANHSTSRFAALADFLERVPATCPHDLFTHDSGARGSQLDSAFIDLAHLRVTRKQNAATDMASLIIPAVGNNKLRLETLQNFMLTNDSATLAIEVPVWLDEEDITALEMQHGIELIPRIPDPSTNRELPRSFTGHIDFIQVRNGAVHLLDYKPDARTNKPMVQLTTYALALTRLVPGLKLFDIKCSWFNEHELNEFFPRTALTHPQR